MPWTTTPLKMHHIFRDKKELSAFSCPKCGGIIDNETWRPKCSRCLMSIWHKDYIGFNVVDAFAGKGYYISADANDFRLSITVGDIKERTPHKTIEEAFDKISKLSLL